MAGLTPDGFEAKSLDEIISAIDDALKSGVSPTLNLSETSLLGQLRAVLASQIRQTWEAAQSIHTNMDIDQAEGAALTALCKLRGTIRRPATFSEVSVNVTLETGFYPAGSLVMHVAGDPTLRFVSDADVTSAPLFPATTETLPVAFVGETAGEVRANSGTLTVIADPVVGFISGTNPLDADPGEPEETDGQLRIRADLELARKGSSTVDAIRADMLASGLFDFVAVFDNDTDVTDGDGRPPHSVEAVVLGGTAAEVAQAIFDAKPAGIRAYGTEPTEIVGDSQGNNHVIGFSRPDEILMYLDVHINYVTGQFAGEQAVKDILTAFADDNQTVGRDVIYSRIVAEVMKVPGVFDTVIDVGDAAFPIYTGTNFTIGPREIARFDSSRIAVLANAFAGPP